MHILIIPIIFQQQCDPNQFSMEETEVLFSSIQCFYNYLLFLNFIIIIIILITRLAL